MIALHPGSTIGILGEGQLGRMLALAAAQLGYRTHVYAPDAQGPAAEVASDWTRATYRNEEALTQFADSVDVVTYEFENIDKRAVAVLHEHGIVRPGVKALAVAQDRTREKQFVTGLGGVTAPWAHVTTLAEVKAALETIGTPAVLKTIRLGYDGKGQARIMTPADAEHAWDMIGRNPAVLEGFVPFEHEFSVILARGGDGDVRFWDSPGNVHIDGVLSTSAVPAATAVLGQVDAARALSRTVADALDYIGVLTLEFFAGSDGPVFNEMAPRVHNSGHWTIEGALTSQFENHIRAICGLPLGDTGIAATRVEMRNLIGPQAGDWATILADPCNHLHLYGKKDARPGRKMGHVTRLTF